MTILNPQDRITTGVTAARLQMETKRSVRPTLLLIAGLMVAAAIAAFLITHTSQTLGHETRTVRFAAPTAFGIFEGSDEVRYRGVPAGTIEKIERRGTQIVLVAKLRKRFGPIFKDARAELRPMTPLNDEYLDIVDQGHEKAGDADPDVPLAQSQTKVSVSVPEVFDTFKSDERNAFRVLLDQLGNGLDDRGAALRAAFAEVVPFLEDAGKLTHQLAVRRKATERLIHNASILTDALGERDVALRRLVREGARTLATFQEGAGDLDGTLEQLGPTFVTLRASLMAVRGVLGDVDSAVTSLKPVAERLPSGLSSLRTLSRDLAPTLRALENPIAELAPFASALTKVAANLRDSSRELLPQVPVLDKVTRDLVLCERGVIDFMQHNTSVTKWGDRNGALPRGNLVVGVPAVGLPGEPVRNPHKGCTPGTPQRGVITPEGER